MSKLSELRAYSFQFFPGKRHLLWNTLKTTQACRIEALTSLAIYSWMSLLWTCTQSLHLALLSGVAASLRVFSQGSVGLKVSSILRQRWLVTVAVTIGMQMVGEVFQGVHQLWVHIVERDSQVRAALRSLRNRGKLGLIAEARLQSYKLSCKLRNMGTFRLVAALASLPMIRCAGNVFLVLFKLPASKYLWFI